MQQRTQWVVEAARELTLGDFDGEVPPTVFTSGHCYDSFLPEQATIVETVSMTYGGVPDYTLHETISDGADILLAQSYVGEFNCFPNAPNFAEAVPGPALAKIEKLGWPAMTPATRYTALFAISKSVLSRAQGTCMHCGEDSGRLPLGYLRFPVKIVVNIRMTLSGPKLR